MKPLGVLNIDVPTSAFGYKRTFSKPADTSAFHPIADIAGRMVDVCF